MSHVYRRLLKLDTTLLKSLKLGDTLYHTLIMSVKAMIRG